MPAKKTPKWTPPELAALRARIRDAMAEQGLSPEALAKRIDRKVETVKLYLADPAYRTQRQPSADFLARVERALGQSFREAAPAPPPKAALVDWPDLEAAVLDLLVRAGAARTDQIARRIGASETKAKRLLLGLYKRKLVDRVRETPATGRRQSQRYVYGAGRDRAGSQPAGHRSGGAAGAGLRRAAGGLGHGCGLPRRYPGPGWQVPGG